MSLSNKISQASCVPAEDTDSGTYYFRKLSLPWKKSQASSESVQNKTKKNSLNVTISCLQTDQLSPSILIKGKLELEGIQPELSFNSASCKTQIDAP